MRNITARRKPCMKKAFSLLLILLLCLCAFAAAEHNPDLGEADDIPINEDTFPDPVFRDYVKEQFDTDGSDSLSIDEIFEADFLRLDGMGVSSLKGIEYLTSLWTLQCSNNQLTQLDLRKNIHLMELRCDKNQLTALDLSVHDNLELLSCTENPGSRKRRPTTVWI